MAEPVYGEITTPAALGEFKLPEGVQRGLQERLARQDRGERLTPGERREVEGLVDLGELLSLLRLRARRIAREASSVPPGSSPAPEETESAGEQP